MKIAILFLFLNLYLFAQPPSLFLLKTYKNDINVTGWVMSEKLDGVRAFWNGERLISRSGKIFNVPKSFTKGFPSFELDGELWSSRGEFEHIVSIVNTKNSNKRWHKLTYNVFEVPNQDGTLLQRLEKVKPFISSRLKLIEQIKINSKKELKTYFDEVIKLGGEGVVVRNPNLNYYTGRTKQALKYKLFKDAECKVVSILKGTKKYKNMMGSIECEFKGKIIKIGSGFSDSQRKKSLEIGTIVTFKYYGLTRLGNPKYPVYLRNRLDADYTNSRMAK